MPTEAADLVATGAGEEVDVINLQRLHAQWALHWVVLHFRAVGHPMARQGCVLKLITQRKAKKSKNQMRRLGIMSTGQILSTN